MRLVHDFKKTRFGYDGHQVNERKCKKEFIENAPPELDLCNNPEFTEGG